MVRTTKIIAAIAVIVLVLAWVIPGGISHLRTAREESGDFFDRIGSDDHIIKRVEVELSRAQKQLNEYVCDQAELEVSLESLEEENENLKGKLVLEESRVKVAKSILEVNQGKQPDELVEIGGRKYTVAKVTQDAHNRMDRIDKINVRMAKNSDMIQSHVSVLAQLRDNVAKAQDTIRQKGSELEEVKAEFASLRSEKAAYEMLAKFSKFTDPLAQKSDLRRALDAAQKRKARLAAQVRVLRERVAPASGVDIVDYDSVLPGPSALDRINSYFSKPAPSAPKTPEVGDTLSQAYDTAMVPDTDAPPAAK